MIDEETDLTAQNLYQWILTVNQKGCWLGAVGCVSSDKALPFSDHLSTACLSVRCVTFLLWALGGEVKMLFGICPASFRVSSFSQVPNKQRVVYTTCASRVQTQFLLCCIKEEKSEQKQREKPTCSGLLGVVFHYERSLGQLLGNVLLHEALRTCPSSPPPHSHGKHPLGNLLMAHSYVNT